jgi:1,4-dihydroxy-2-naphthoate octaprenyltransferase
MNTWLIAARPRTLTAALVPVLVGCALAIRAGQFDARVALATLLCATLIQIGTNFANDLHDFKKGADTPARLGPMRVTSAGLLTPQQIERGMWVIFGLAVMVGLYLAWVGGWPIVVIGLLSILAGLAYTAGPYPLGYHGLGDVAVFIFFGLVAVVGTYYTQTHSVTAPVIVAAVPIGALATNILVVNNVRDADTDRMAGKRTLAVLLGRNAARAEYVLLMLIAYFSPLVLWFAFGFDAWILLPLISLPVAWRWLQFVRQMEGPALNQALGGTAQLLALYGALFALGIVLLV